MGFLYFIAVSMTKFLKPGKVVIVTKGRFACKKAVIVQNTDGKSKERRIERRSRVGAFLRVFNHKHMFATRYNMDLSKELRGKISVADAAKKSESRGLVRKVFQARFNSGSNRWFFQKLRF